jgi:hypothetical protein
MAVSWNELLFNRWVSLFVGLLLESVSGMHAQCASSVMRCAVLISEMLVVCVFAGTMYVFSVWSPSLQTRMSYTDKQINFIGTCANWGVYLGFIPGLFYDYTGPRLTCLLVQLTLAPRLCQ